MDGMEAIVKNKIKVKIGDTIFVPSSNTIHTVKKIVNDSGVDFVVENDQFISTQYVYPLKEIKINDIREGDMVYTPKWSVIQITDCNVTYAKKYPPKNYCFYRKIEKNEREQMNKEPILWINPKPKIKNTLEHKIGDCVVINGGANIFKYNSYCEGTKDSLFKVIHMEDAKPKIGDLIICSISKDILAIVNSLPYKQNIEDDLYRVIRNENEENPFPEPKLEATKYSCGTIIDNQTNTEITDTKGYIIELNKWTLEDTAICDKYNVTLEQLVPKEASIMSQLKITLDHKLNVANNEFALLVGESGSGKTSIAIEYAKQKKVPYVIMQGTNQLTVDDLLGYKSITTGEYVGSLLREAVEKGKIFILDEIDACNPNTLLVLNSLKSTHFQFPDKKIKIHKNFRLIATANTLTPSENYLRNNLDIATIHRFDVIEYNLKDYELALRYGFKYIKELDLKKLTTPRVIERAVTKLKIREEDIIVDPIVLKNTLKMYPSTIKETNEKRRNNN